MVQEKLCKLPDVTHIVQYVSTGFVKSFRVAAQGSNKRIGSLAYEDYEVLIAENRENMESMLEVAKGGKGK